MLVAVVVTAVVLVTGTTTRTSAQAPGEVTERSAAPRLAPTSHPPVPGHPSLFLLLPDLSVARSVTGGRQVDTAEARFARGVQLIVDGNFEGGLPLVSGSGLSPVIAPYAQYYAAVALKGLNRLEAAEAALNAAAARQPDGYLRQALPMQQAEVALARGDARRAIDLIEPLAAAEKLASPEDVFLQLGRAAELAGSVEKALAAYRRVYYEFPLSTQAIDAERGIERLETSPLIPSNRFQLELSRAERLFAAKRWAQARAAFEPLGRAATASDDRELIALRVAECDYYLDRARSARESVRPYLNEEPRKAEARFFYLTATRALGELDSYVSLATRFIADFPDSTWTEETLNNLATHYVVENDDGAADQVFRELYQRFPHSRYAERAAWKIGWWAYRNDRFDDAAQAFEGAAAAFPRADLRPAWLYWSGRARDHMQDESTANARYRLTATDYHNSYYGRLASTILADRREPPVEDSVVSEGAGVLSAAIPTDPLVRQLVRLEMYDTALQELQYAQRVWGDSPSIQATVAWIRHRRGLEQTSMERFQNLRGAITLMKRAYPQYLAAGGESLPPEVLGVIYPLDYWPLIKKYSDQFALDPYLMVALIAQESTFTADVRSAANAYGLMQLIPSTGRRYASKVGIRRFSSALLTQPETNIRLGMTYFKELVTRFGGVHYALASYNAGEQRIARWIEERPGVPQDEFIDNIPFPETQNYVKRILGTAEDYRRLYGDGILTPGLSAVPVSSATAKSSTSSRKPAPAPAKKPAPRKRSRR